MLVCVQGLGKEVVAGEDHDDRQVLVNKSQNTVLQLTRHDSLAVKVGNLLDLQSTLQGSGELGSTTQQQQTLLVFEELGAHLLDRVVQLENLAELLRDLAKALHDLLASLLLRGTVLAQRQSEHDHGHELRSVSLGGGNTDLGTSVDVNTAVSKKGDGGTDDVDNTNGQSTTLQTVAESHQRISGLTGLGNEDTGVITEHRGLSVQEVGGQLNGDGDFGQLLKDTTDSHARVVAGTAGDEDNTAATTNGRNVLTKTTQGDLLVDSIQTTTHCVDNGLGLLENLLLHKVVELALHDLLQLQLNSLDGTDIGGTIVLGETVDVQLTLVNVSNVIILQVEDLLGVLDNSGGVGGKEELGGLGDTVIRQESPRLGAVQQGLVRGSQKTGGGLFDGNILGGLLRRESTLLGVLDVDKVDLHLLGGSHTDDQRGTLTGRDNLMGVVNGLDQQTKSTLQLLNNGLGQDSELNIGVLVVEVLGKLRNALGIGLSLETETLALQKGLQFLVVGDNTIVDDGKLPGGIGAIDRWVVRSSAIQMSTLRKKL